MKVLIIENEIYLAQSIAMRLSDMNYSCEIINAYEELGEGKNYDIILLSTNTKDFLRTVEKFKNAIVILLVSYISMDTVSNPLKMGASDYIQKPFMMEELLRKIKHHQDFKKLSILNQAYKAYIKSKLSAVKLPEYHYKKIKLPLVIKTNKQSYADAFVFDYISECDMLLSYVDLSATNAVEKFIKTAHTDRLLFLSNFQVLKNAEKEKLLAFIQNKPVILHTHLDTGDLGLNSIDFNDDEKNLDSNEILTIEEYVKYVITTYQNVFADTDLSKKLGISRKSLWEKRKKYEIKKKK